MANMTLYHSFLFKIKFALWDNYEEDSYLFDNDAKIPLRFDNYTYIRNIDNDNNLCYNRFIKDL